jgi:hypothetical protein
MPLRANFKEMSCSLSSTHLEQRWRAHRYIVQKRMKLHGARWTPENAEHMFAIRVCRANREWLVSIPVYVTGDSGNVTDSPAKVGATIWQTQLRQRGLCHGKWKCRGCKMQLVAKD